LGGGGEHRRVVSMPYLSILYFFEFVASILDLDSSQRSLFHADENIEGKIGIALQD